MRPVLKASRASGSMLKLLIIADALLKDRRERDSLTIGRFERIEVPSIPAVFVMSIESPAFANAEVTNLSPEPKQVTTTIGFTRLGVISVCPPETVIPSFSAVLEISLTTDITPSIVVFGGNIATMLKQSGMIPLVATSFALTCTACHPILLSVPVIGSEEDTRYFPLVLVTPTSTPTFAGTMAFPFAIEPSI